MYARKEKLECRSRSKQEGSSGILLQQSFTFRVLEMPFSAFLAVHFLSVNTEKNASVVSFYLPSYVIMKRYRNVVFMNFTSGKFSSKTLVSI